MLLRPYAPDRDRDAVHRIWTEVGWLETDDEHRGLDYFLEDGRILVADLHGAAECMAASTPATLRYLDEDLSLSAVTAVLTSRIARKQGLAKRLTAALVAAEAADGALVSALGMFEQGFYDQIGFGTGGYEHRVHFDPAHLTVSRKVRPPRRLTEDDWALMHQAMLTRRRGHGACTLLPGSNLRAELAWQKNGFGLGYCDGPDGALTHFFWNAAKGEHGPDKLVLMAYQNGDQFLELMALLKALSDQVRLVMMTEPRDIQFQDLLRHPMRQREITANSEFGNQCTATAWWQMRICNLAGCLAKTHLRREPVRFNLALHDPIEAHLDAEAPWRGLSGRYVVTLGPTSHAEPGEATGLPTLTASVGAFTRLWLGVRPATGLAVTDSLSGPPDLLETLNDTLCLPDAKPEWEF